MTNVKKNQKKCWRQPKLERVGEIKWKTHTGDRDKYKWCKGPMPTACQKYYIIYTYIQSNRRFLKFKLQRWFHKWFVKWIQREKWTSYSTIIIYIWYFYPLLLFSVCLTFFEFFFSLFFGLYSLAHNYATLACWNVVVYYHLLHSMEFLIVIFSKWCIIQIECLVLANNNHLLLSKFYVIYSIIIKLSLVLSKQQLHFS